MTHPRRHLRRAEAAFAIACALLSLAFYARLPAAFPSPDDEAALRQRLNQLASPGDAVLLAPHWAERARLFGLTAPVLNLSRHATPHDLAGFSGLFVLSFDELPRADREATFDLLERAGFQPTGGVETFGVLSLTRFVPKSPREVLFRATDALSRPQTRASLVNARGQRLACRRAAQDLICQDHPRRSRLRAETREIHFRPYRCLTFAPLGRHPLALDFNGVPHGPSLDLVAGPIGQAHLRRTPHAPLTLTATIDGEKVGEWQWQPGDSAEKRATIDMSHLGKGPHTLHFEVTGDDRRQVDFCFEAEVRR